MLNSLLNDLRNNLRLRLWLALIVGALGLYGILLLKDALHNAVQQQQAAAQSVGRLQAQLAQTEWLERLPAANILAVQLEGRLWQAPTAGLAQAALQDWLNASLVQSKATKPLITVTVLDEITAGGDNNAAPFSPPAATADGTPATPPDLWKIKAKVGFDFTQESLLAFLSLIESHEKQIIIETLNVRKEPVPHVEVQLLAYFQKQAQTVITPTAADAAKPPDVSTPAAMRP